MRFTEVANIRNFDESRMKRKLFLVSFDNNKTTQVCEVCAIANSKKELEENPKKKRQKFTPLKHLESPSECSDDNIEATADPSHNSDKDGSRLQTEVNLNKRLSLLEVKRKMTEETIQSQRKVDHQIRNNNFDTAQVATSCTQCDLNNQTIPQLRQQLHDKEEAVKKIEEEFDASRKQNDRLQNELKNTDAELKEVQSLNRSWHESSLSNWEKMECIINAIKTKRKESLNCGRQNTTFEIGYLSDDGKEIHIGRDIWMAVSTYAFVTANVKSASVLTRNLTSALFDDNTLCKSTITGKSSNRKQNKTSELAQLDPVKVMVIKEFVRHYLVHEMHLREEDADAEADSVRTWISKKIADLKEARKPCKKIKLKKSVNDSSKESAEEGLNQEKDDGSNVINISGDIDEVAFVDPFVTNVSVDNNNENVHIETIAEKP